MSILEVNKLKKQKMQIKEGLHALFDYTTEGILITNDRGEILKINPSAEKMFAYQKGELLGKKIEILVPQKFSKKHEYHRENFNVSPHARSMGADLELYAKRKDDSEFPVEISLSPYSTADEKFVIAFIIDVTIRKRAEEKLKTYSQELEKEVHNRTLILREAIAELEKTKEELSQSLEKERELNEMKSRFVSMASHEFRTPLATILSSLSLTEKYIEKKYEEKRQKHITRIKSVISNMTDILNDFLSIGKLEEGHIHSIPANFNIVEFVESMIYDIQPITKPEQKIYYQHHGKYTKVYLDKKILKNILTNLISNAIKFSEEAKQIEVSTEIKKAFLFIQIKDQGVGISKEEQKHLFERFFRARNATNIQGTGLGLNIVKKYVELMDGNIDFKSKLDKGTTFTIKFPCHEKNITY